MDETTTDIVPVSTTAIRKLEAQYPDFCKPVFGEAEKCQNELLRQLSAQMPNAVNVIQTANAADAYKVVGDVVLQQGDDGLFSAVLRDENGKITQHVKLEKSVSDVARAASFAYSALNAAVGQANMMAIAERLAAIETQLDEAKKRDYIEQIEAVKSACVGLNEALCLSDEDHRKQTILERRNDLRKALGTLHGFIKLEIEAMPEYRNKTFWARLFSNWGSEKSTLPKKAQKRFECVIETLPVWCRGMSFLVLTDSYLGQAEYPSAREMEAGLTAILVDSGLPRRVEYVPMMGKTDQIELVKEFRQRIPETKKVFERMRSEAIGGKMAITLSKD